jgi:hypothetical protein
LLDARVALEIDAQVNKGMPGNGQSVIPESALEIVLRKKSPVMGLLGFVREYCYPPRQPILRIASAAANPAAPPPTIAIVPSETSCRPIRRNICALAGFAEKRLSSIVTGYSSRASKAGAAVASSVSKSKHA